MNTKAASSLLFQSQVNYLNGIPDKLKTIFKLQFEVSETGLTIYAARRKKRFPPIAITYEQIVSITFRKGMGSGWYNNIFYSRDNESLFLICYKDAEGKLQFLDLEMLYSTKNVVLNCRQTQVLKQIFLSLPVLAGKIASE